MKRVQNNKGRQESGELFARLQTLSAISNRLLMAQRMGESFGGDRDIYDALGYPKDITPEQYLLFYRRHDMAKAVINRPIKVCWRGPLSVMEMDDDKETAFESVWKELEKEHKVRSTLIRADRLTGLGRYGVLLLGLDDIRGPEDYILPVTPGKRKLIYIRAAGERHIGIDKWNENPSDPRYGLPEVYSMSIANQQGKSQTLAVHHTRVIHLAEECLEDEVYGTPRLEALYNRLMDLEKLVGGSAEMFWKGARPGYAANVDKDFQLTKGEQESLKEKIDEYEHNLRRILMLEGVSMESLAQQVADPRSHVDVQVQMVSAVTGIPKRILTGSERGELSSAQDQDEWNTYVQSRREDFVEPEIVRPLVDRLIELSILPTPKEGYSIQWQDLFSVSDMDRAKLGETRARAIKEYVTHAAAELLIPPSAFYSLCLGLDEEQIAQIDEQKEQYLRDLEQEEDEDEGEITPDGEEDDGMEIDDLSGDNGGDDA